MELVKAILIISALVVAWALLIERAHRNVGPAQAKLMRARGELVFAFLTKASAFTVNYYLASTALIKILGMEFFERDPLLRTVFKGSHIAGPHLMAIFIIASSFALASMLLDPGRRVLHAVANRAWQVPQNQFLQDMAKFGALAALAYVVIVHLDTHLMLFRTATMLFMNELGAATPGEMLDLPSIYQKFGGTAGAWLLHILSIAYPAMILGTTLLFAKAKEHHEQAIVEAVAEEDMMAAFEDDEEDLADEDVVANIPAPPMPVPGPAPAIAAGPAPRAPRIRFPFGGLPWHRPVPQNNGRGGQPDGDEDEGEGAGVPGNGEAQAA